MSQINYHDIEFDEELMLVSNSFKMSSGRIGTAPEKRVQVFSVSGSDAEAQRLTTIKATTEHDDKNVMKVVASCTAFNTSFFLIDDSNGVLMTRENRLNATQHLSPAEEVGQIVAWSQDLLCALSHMHNKKCSIVDLNPTNLLLCNNIIVLVCPRVCDWGTNVRIEEYDLRYTSPDVEATAVCCQEADCYGYGCTLLEIITSEPPPIRDPSRLQEFSINDDTWPPHFPEELKSFIEPLLMEKASISFESCKQYFIEFPRCSIPWAQFALYLDKPDACSLLDAVVQLQRCCLPKDRAELLLLQFTTPELIKVHQDATLHVERQGTYVNGSVDFDHACALAVYTNESLVYKILNAVTTAASLNVFQDGEPTMALLKRICKAAMKIGVEFRGTARRFVFADQNKTVKNQLQQYETHFATGKVISSFQLESFTTSSIAPFETQSRPLILYTCLNLEGFRISQYSMSPRECEVLVVPPSKYLVEGVRATPVNGHVALVEVQISYIS